MYPSAAHAFGSSAMRWELGLDVQAIITAATGHSQSIASGGNNGGFEAI